MASFNLEYLTGVLSCIKNTLASPWMAVFLVLLIFFRFFLTETLIAMLIAVQRNVTESLQSLLGRKTFNATLCIIFVGLVLLGLYLTLNHAIIGNVVVLLGLFLTRISFIVVFSDIKKVSTMGHLILECLISTRYLAFYLALDPALRPMGFSAFSIGSFAQGLQFSLNKIAEENSREDRVNRR